MDHMNQTPDTTTTDRPTVTVPGITRIIGRNVADLAAMLRTIEPEELSRVELLSLLGVIAASAELSAALLDDLADRMNREAAERPALAVTTRWIADDAAARGDR